MTYEAALKELKRVGAKHAQGDVLLAMTCEVLSHVHAINPKLVYAGAVKQRLTHKQLMQLDPVALGDLMFVE